MRPTEKRPNLWYPIFFFPDGSDFYATENNKPKESTHIKILPINDDGEELSWYWKKEKVNTEKYNLLIKKSRKGEFTLYKKQRPGIGDMMVNANSFLWRWGTISTPCSNPAL
ncbi:MAG: hypothetical protein WCR46_10890 [Deltaproteobacteria bacterium]